MSVALVKIQIRNDLAEQWVIANPFLSDGEPGAESDTGRLKIGNGKDRWIDLPYVGGGSGGGGNPLTGIIDGGVFTGSPSNVQCSAPFNPAASKVVRDGQEKVAISWGAAYPYKPDTTVIVRYTVEYSQNPSEGSWTYCCDSFPTDTPDEAPNNFAISDIPSPQASDGSYFYRVKAVLSSEEDAEWGYTGEYRHFRSPVPTTFELDPESENLGSNSETGDNQIAIIVTNLAGDVKAPIEWSYPSIAGVSFTKDLVDTKLLITNTQGASTPTQQFFVQCTINDVVRSATINLSNTITDDPVTNPPTDYLPVFEWELVEDEEATESLPGRSGQFPQEPFLVVPERSLFRETDESGVCSVSRSLEFEFTGFTILLQSPNCRPGPDNITAVNQFKRLDVAGGCTAANMQRVDGSTMQIANPVLTSVMNKPELYEAPVYQGKWSEYQIIDDVDINGSKASYLLVQPSFLDQTVVTQKEKNIQEPELITTVTQTNSASFLLCTKNGGTTFSLVDPRGTNRSYAIDTQTSKTSDNAFPMMLAKAVSVTGGREVLVAMYRFESGEKSVDQFYFTSDHVNWVPCTNADRLPPDVESIWTVGGVTYATSPIHTGTVIAGKRSYYRSPKR